MSLHVGGKLPFGEHLKELQSSSNYKEGAFKNQSSTPMMAEDASYWKMLKDFFKKNPDKIPSRPMPVVKTDLVNNNLEQPWLVWFGHSSYLMKINGKTILVDPVFSGHASPLRFMVNAFPGTDAYKVDDLPFIDYLIITHDHYDHLDFKTVTGLKSKVGKVFCSLGVSSHLKYWGYEFSTVQELDWWQTAAMDQYMQITAAPARHFSGRGLKRGQTFWSSFIVQTQSHRLYLGGDSGYDNHFREIGKKFGPFDIALLECGQYNKMWPYIHMLPEETVKAAKDLQAAVLMPVHWGKFSLAMHPWNEPIQRASREADKLGVTINMPRIGEPLRIGAAFKQEEWWNNV